MTDDELRRFALDEYRDVTLMFLLSKTLQSYPKAQRKAIISGIRDTWKQDVHKNIGNVSSAVDLEQLSVLAIKAIKLTDRDVSSLLVAADDLAKDFDDVNDED